MKKLKLIGVILISALVFVGCEKENLNSDLNKQLEDVTEKVPKVNNKSSNFTVVRDFYEAFEDVIDTSSIYEDFVNYHYDEIQSNSNYTIAQSDIDDLIVDLGSDFENKLQEVNNLGLSYDDFSAILVQINISNGSNNSGVFSSGLSCLICNEKACAVSQAITTAGNASQPPTPFFGWVGQWIHCE